MNEVDADTAAQHTAGLSKQADLVQVVQIWRPHAQLLVRELGIGGGWLLLLKVAEGWIGNFWLYDTLEEDGCCCSSKALMTARAYFMV